MDLAVPADHRIKLKEGEKWDKYWDLTRELKKLWNMKVTVILVIGHIYPTPPLGQDMTQGQFFKRSVTGLNSEFSFS